MVSQLLKNDKISFVVSKPFSSRGKDYAVGDDFPQEEASDIEVFVRARYVIPVVEDPADKIHIRHWHRHIRPKEEVLERLRHDRVQLVWPTPPDSEEVVSLETLIHPELTEPPDESGEAAEDQADGPGVEPEAADEEEVPDGTIAQIKAWVGDDLDRAQRALDAENAGQERSTLISYLEGMLA